MAGQGGVNRSPERKNAAIALGFLVCGLWSESTLASNHLDTPAVIVNPQANIGDHLCLDGGGRASLESRHGHRRSTASRTS